MDASQTGLAACWLPLPTFVLRRRFCRLTTMSFQKTNVHLCAAVGCGAPSLLRCSRCEDAWYCTVECQRRSWSSHKGPCEEMAAVIKKLAEALLEEEDSSEEEESRIPSFCAAAGCNKPASLPCAEACLCGRFLLRRNFLIIH